jgi:hypothetical protein
VLTVVNPFDAAQRHTVALLGQAIYRSNRGEKYISHWGDITTKSGKIIDLFDEYDTTAARKGAVNAQILATVPRRN